MKRHEAAFDRREIDAALSELGTENEAAALSALCALAKAKAAREYIDAQITNDKLTAALLSGAPKARKNAARLIGALERPQDEAVLLQAFAAEQTRLVRPSLLLALGAVGGQAAHKALHAYKPQAAQDETEQKHVQEETEALRRALLRLQPPEKHVFCGFPVPHSALLCALAGFAPLLIEELDELGFSAKPAGCDEVSVAVQELAPLFQARCFVELLFPLSEGIAPTPTAVAAAARVPFTRLLQSCHEGKPPFAYRVEYGALSGRAAFIAELATLMDEGGTLINSPSGYEAELRLLPMENGRLRLLCKLYTVPDTRFAYRKRALPASMHPAMAACLARYTAQFARDARSVLDPCCGSGTLLVEWGKLRQDARLVGVDIAQGALDIARENLAAAGVKAALLHKDCTAFDVREPYDVVLCNLPFGTRVGTHEDNETLYAGLCARLSEWLSPGGVAVLYTMEFKLLRRCLRAQPGLAFLEEARTAAGGLLPHVLSVRKV